MCHHFLHEDFPEPVSHNDHDAVVVAANIENCVGRHVIGGIEELPDMVKVPESRKILHVSPPLRAGTVELENFLQRNDKSGHDCKKRPQLDGEAHFHFF